MKYAVIYGKGPASWGAYFPGLPGVIAAGDSREEAEGLIREAVALRLKTTREEGQTVPEPSSLAGEVVSFRQACVTEVERAW